MKNAPCGKPSKHKPHPYDRNMGRETYFDGKGRKIEKIILERYRCDGSGS